FRKKLGKMRHSYTSHQQPQMQELLAALRAKLGPVPDSTMPNFFCIGYSVQQGKAIDPKTQTVEQINAEARSTLDDGFMTDFLKDVVLALRFSAEQSLEAKKAAVASLRSALPVFSAEPLNPKACKAALKSSAAAVKASIDPLQLEKDNLAYVYESGTRAYIERYFASLKQNPKEERRFARDTQRYELDKKKGKITHSVIPKNLIDTEAAQRNLRGMAQNLIDHFEAQMNAGAEDDFDARAVDMVDYLKARAEDYAFELSKGMARHRAIELMKEVGIPEPHKRYHQYPFEFSGGMRQRIVIAIALSANPDILICDEPTTALDVTIQAQILELINRLKAERRLSVIFITHDLGVVANMADKIAIMYAGKIVEYGTADDVFYDPRHPYTWALLSSMPDLETKEKLEAIPGTPPDMILPPKGDAFAPRNKYAMQIDLEEQPPAFRVSDTHWAATWLLHPDAPKVEPPAIVTERIHRMQKEQAEREAAETTKGGAEA
ncbi:MAG: ATP-binding cassette domain-containing protein, partial [Clostridia bacterium]|nr:ATP-binding cassette domain-containing protein [Clostridia bacterium]